MLKWGTVITVFYALVLAGFLVPATAVLLENVHGRNRFYFPLAIYQQRWLWVLLGIPVAGQALLLFLSVDTSRQRLKPRAHILVSCVLTGTLWALLTAAAILSLGFGIYGDNFGRDFIVTRGTVLACWTAFWLLWTILFYLYVRNSNASITRAASWLLKGSVLELLIAVPSHVMARRRDDCSAPIVTSFGITTGIAIMLMSFGPGVLLLYKKRLDGYANRKPAKQ
jgi:hypothetical protein